jgi:hypothetical protein
MQSLLTVNPEWCRVGRAPHSVLRRALIRSPVLHSHPTDVYVTDDVTSHRHVLADHEPVPEMLVTGHIILIVSQSTVYKHPHWRSV